MVTTPATPKAVPMGTPRTIRTRKTVLMRRISIRKPSSSNDRQTGQRSAIDASEDKHRKKRHPGIVNPHRDAQGRAGGVEQGQFIVDGLNHIDADQNEEPGTQKGAENHQDFFSFSAGTG